MQTHNAEIHLAHLIREEIVFQSALAMGRSAPNPPVGCALVLKCNSGYVIIGGATEAVGKRHAEIVCLDHYDKISQKKSKKSLKEAISRMYVSLEPCVHYGRTPPCTTRILAEPQMKRILAWEKDPFLQFSGIELLDHQGKRADFLATSSEKKIKTKIGHAFLKGFLNRINGMGPRLHLKVACTRDNIMGIQKERLAISGEATLSFTHLLRAKFDAILVGMGTVLSDLPSLNLRLDLLQKKFDNESSFLFPSKSICESYLEEDILSYTFFKYCKELTRLICENTFEYQPDRIFVLGKYEKAFLPFFFLQQKVAEQTKKPSIFYMEETQVNDWRKHLPQLIPSAILPAMKEKKVFASALRRVLGEGGYNEVLIEGGQGVFSALESELQCYDRIYIIRSKRSYHDIISQSHYNPNKAQPEKRIVHLPKFMQKASLISRYKELYEEDTVEIHRP